MISPKTIKKHLDQYVSGQEEAKKLVANTIFMQCLRTNYMLDHEKILDSAEKHINITNVLLTGPSGCGKTYIIEKAAEKAGLPVVKINAKSLSNTGYVGSTFQEMLIDEYDSCRQKELFEYAVIVIDEVDKICGVASGGRESDWYLGLQHMLLKVVEGTTESIIHKGLRSSVPINTNQMLFLFAGNFEDIRINREVKPSIGFEKTEIEHEAITKELLKAGMIKELVGRISSVAEVHELTKENYIDIIKNKKGTIIDSYVKLFHYSGTSNKLSTEIDNNEELIYRFAEECQELGLGARGLVRVISNYFSDYINELEIEDTPEEKQRKLREKSSVFPGISYQNPADYGTIDLRIKK